MKWLGPPAARAADGEMIAEVIETEFRADAVRDIAFVRRAFFHLARTLLQEADAEPEVRKCRARKLAVTLGEIRIHRRDVRAAAFQCEDKCGHQRDERLALAGRHFGDAAIHERERGHELAVVRREAARAVDGVRDQPDRADGEIVARRAAARFFPQRRGVLVQPRFFLVRMRLGDGADRGDRAGVLAVRGR